MKKKCCLSERFLLTVAILDTLAEMIVTKYNMMYLALIFYDAYISIGNERGNFHKLMFRLLKVEVIRFRQNGMTKKNTYPFTKNGNKCTEI